MTTPVTVTAPFSESEAEAAHGMTLAFTTKPDAEAEVRYATAFGDVVDDVQSVDGLDLTSLRHVLATQDFSADVRRWQRALGRPELVTDTDSGIAVGKALSWRKGGSGPVIAVVVLGFDCFMDVVKGVSLSRGILCHELAHVHDNARRMADPDTEPHPTAHDLGGIDRFIGQSLWSEYFAERIASRHSSDADLAGFVANADTIKSFLIDFEHEKYAYRSHENLLHLWQRAILTVGRAADMIGRTVGELHRDRHRHLFDEFARGLGRPAWATVAGQVRDELAGSISDSSKPLGVSVGVIRSMFHALGVYPQLQAGGQLYVDVP
jgi:hypothetical protein